MTDSTPAEFVAAYELTRYPPEKVLALIEAVRRWVDDGAPDATWGLFDTFAELEGSMPLD